MRQENETNKPTRKISTTEFINTRSETSTAGRQAIGKRSERERESRKKTTTQETDGSELNELCSAVYIMTHTLTTTVLVMTETGNKNQGNNELLNKMADLINEGLSAVEKNDRKGRDKNRRKTATNKKKTQ